MLVLINLDDAVARRRHMAAQLDAQGLPYVRVGFDGRRRPADDIEAWCRERFGGIEFDFDALSGAEVGCWLSHLSAWQLLRPPGAPAACAVLEDDVQLAPGFANIVGILERAACHDVVYLGTSSRNISAKRRTAVDALWVHEPVGGVLNTWGYVIRRDYVERFFARPLKVRMPIDHFLGGGARQARPRIGVLQPPAVTEDAAMASSSQIEPYTFRPDRWKVLEGTRRRLLASRVGELYYSLYRLL